MSDTIGIKVRTIDDRTIDLFIDPKESILTLKQEIQKKLDINPDHQRLLYQGRHLKNDGAAAGATSRRRLCCRERAGLRACQTEIAGEGFGLDCGQSDRTARHGFRWGSQ